MDDLKKQAEELGIKIDGRWSEDRLREEVDKALLGGGPESPDDNQTTERLIPVKIERDFWDAEGNRHRKGAIVEVSVEAALDGVETGALSRVK